MTKHKNTDIDIGDLEPASNERKTGFSVKTKIRIFLIFVLGAAFIFAYFYFQNTGKLKSQYEAGIRDLETLNNERNRCTELLSQEAGNFGDYEYCRKLLQEFSKNTD